MSVPRGRFARAAGTLFVTLASLCGIAAAITVAQLPQVLASERFLSIQDVAVDTDRPVRQMRGCGVTFPFYLHSLTRLDLPMKGASQHMSSGFAVDEDWLRLIPTPATYMAFNLVQTLRISSIAMAAGAVISGCGGGGSTPDDTASASGTSSVASVTGNSDTTSSVTSANSVSAPVDTKSSDVSASTAAAAAADDSSSLVASAAPAATEATTAVSLATNSTSSAGLTTAAVTTEAVTAAIGVLGASPVTTQKSTRSALGINLGTLDYYSPTLPTIDLMKKASAWITQCNSYAAGNTCKNFTGSASAYDTLEEASLNLDANGWPLTLPAASNTSLKFRSVSTTILSGGWQQAGQYIVRYDGSGTLGYSGVGTKNAAQSTAGRDVLNVINTNGSGLIVSITASTPGNYIRNIRVYPPGGACAADLTTYAASAASCTGAQGAFVAFENFPAGSIWHPAFLSELKGFRSARFMDWQRTNSSTTANWAQRTTATARSWNTAAGIPTEEIANLANTANLDPWVNVPTYATDDYVTQFGQVLHQQLASNLTVNVEYSNETWNYAFPASHWMYTQGQAAWPAEVAANTNPYLLQANWYANRLVQVCNIIKGQFGADKNRVRCVANTQAAQSASAGYVLNCTVAAKTLGQACGKSIDVLAIAPYFGGYIGAAKLRPTIASWYSQADGGLSQLFNEIMGSEATTAVVAPLMAAGSTVTGGSLAQIRGWMTTNKAVADQFHIPLWAYEGGQGITPPAGDTDKTFQSLLLAANRDPRMGVAYTKMLSDWQASGGQTFSLFNDVATPSQYGDWGLKENQFDTTAAKWMAVAKVRDTVACWWSGC